ncbi:AraC-like ligand-binding domain-containing protein [Methylobacterium haplocladii]|uniref:HTH araC/xylS-type domain-containing protein n=1 Tax=Methylobacterium haplocladii TaxID=1176176 RepID=A0A512IPK4_9HYPH|nr:AraC family transcriptional regulator [Methylobacterium haplocladii]GEO99636.1 hypothetical protein MHA02_20240 [Methylobacterium haplocladii]GJD83330.1 Transcriptional activator NphR [Methylobacterium haplocladii]GLS58205.1 hypothetical protein GCM10007887_08620 [Methylobacterium haplocladii]
MTTAIVRHSIRLADGDAAYRVAAWQEAMGTSGEIQMTAEEAERFTSESTWRRLGPAMVGRITASDFRLVRTKAAAERIGLDHVFVNVVEDGRGHGTCGKRRMDFGIGSLMITKLSSPAHYQMEGMTFTVIVLPRNLLEAAMGPVDPFDGRVFKAESPEALILGAHIRALLDLPDPLAPAKAALAGRSCLSLLASCLDRASPRPSIGTDEDRETANAIRRYIDEHLADPDLGPAMIGRAFALSRSRLYRLMSASGDVAATIRRLRLARAHREIASRRMVDVPVAQIAAGFGFRQERSFRRAFQDAFGYSPAALRDKARAGVRVVLPASGAVIEDWFKEL